MQENVGVTVTGVLFMKGEHNLRCVTYIFQSDSFHHDLYSIINPDLKFGLVLTLHTFNLMLYMYSISFEVEMCVPPGKMHKHNYNPSYKT